MEQKVSSLVPDLLTVPELELYQLLLTALQGNRLAVDRFVHGLVRNPGSGATSDLVRIALRALKATDSAVSPFRSDTQASIPVDSESHMRLLRTEFPSVLEYEPIWSATIEREMRQIVEERAQMPSLHAAGLTAVRSCLFVGPPGTGKTLAARWLARELAIPLLSLDLSTVISSLLGRTGTNIRNVLDFAKGLPCLLLLDEFDAIAKRRDDDIEIGELKRLVTVLLQEIDLWPERSVLVGATNHPELLDRALWRRFDVTITFGSPSTLQAREAIAQALDGSRIDTAFLEVAAEIMSAGSFSDIKRDVHSARRAVIVRNISIETALRDLLRERIKTFARASRHDLAVRLLRMERSQREIHDLTGVSRDTLRKFAVMASSRG